jgi:hypothetical protein
MRKPSSVSIEGDKLLRKIQLKQSFGQKDFKLAVFLLRKSDCDSISVLQCVYLHLGTQRQKKQIFNVTQYHSCQNIRQLLNSWELEILKLLSLHKEKLELPEINDVLAEN